jgi:AcrR family transcriptional regulator
LTVATSVHGLAEERVLRADAQRNLTRILEAARAVFAEHGSDASVAEIAERAGVGTATIFRRFPTKEDLLAAVVRHRVEELVAVAREASEAEDPGQGLRRFMLTAADAYIHDRCFCEARSTRAFNHDEVRGLVDELLGYVETILSRAKEAGEVRDDVSALDIPVLLMAVARVGLDLEPAVPGAWHRYLDLVIDGLRPCAARPLSRKPLTRKQFEATGKSRR